MSKSPQRKTINNIITNIRQIASNISKDVSMAQPIVLPSPQPKQPKQDQNSSQTKSNKSDSIQIRLARSARITLPESDTIADAQPSPDLHEIVQGIQNAHVKVDEALRFMTNMKQKLDAEPLVSKNEAVTSNKQGVLKVRSLVDQPKLYPQNTQQQKSVPDLQTPSLGALPMSLEDLKVSPRSTIAGSAPYFGHTDAPYFNPFAKSATNKSSEAFAGIAQKNQVFTTSTVPSLNLGTNQNFIQMMKNQTGSNTKISPVYTPSSTLPSSILAQQSSACDHNRLNQIISTIKHRDHALPTQPKTNPHQPQSLNDLQFGSVNSLTSIHDQLARPNTVSHLSKPPLRSNWFISPNESNFYQVLPQNNTNLSHYASQNSLHEIRNRHGPNLTTTTAATTVYQHPPIYVNSYIGGGARTVGSFHSEGQGDGEEFFRPRRLTFEEPRSKKNSPYMEEVKQRRPVQKESHYKVQKTMRRRSDVHKKQNVYEDIINDEDSIMNKECCCEHHHQCHSRKVSRYSECGLDQVESSASSQSDEESCEEYIEYEKVKPKKAKEQQLCSNCQCQRSATQQTYRTHVDVGSGQVCGSQRRSNSRKQQQSLVVHNVPLHTKINSNETEEVQILRRNKSIDNTQPKTNVRRKTHITILKTRPVVEIQNNENLTQDNVQESEKKQKVSFENLRKRDENQSVLQRQRSIQVNTKKVLEKRDSKNSLYDKEFVDQLAIDFPANGEKAREQTVFKTVAAQKTEIAKKPRRVPL